MKSYQARKWLLLMLMGRALLNSSWFTLSTPSSNKRSVEYKMASEVMITRRGGGENLKLITEYIATNKTWIVPSGAKNNEFDIRIFGAGSTMNNGSSYSAGYGGGSGWMNNAIYNNLTIGSSISITIGDVDIANSSGTNIAGGSTSFGTYLSANGGSGCNGGSGGMGNLAVNGGRGYQFGGGAGKCGGSGGTWGGGGTGFQTASGSGNGSGGCGGIYGGGGGAVASQNGIGGNGGIYGGGGGSYNTLAGGRGGCSNPANGELASTRYGGNGGNIVTLAENGTNTSTWTNVDKDGISGEYLRGWGRFGANKTSTLMGGGGGGFGGNGGKANTYGGGGGGYGSNGGSYTGSYSPHGGGGGYGGDGGFGGGGYGKVSIGTRGGGGYYCPAGGIRDRNIHFGHGGGGIGIWLNNVFMASFGSGGRYYDNKLVYAAEPGICIIQYYSK